MFNFKYWLINIFALNLLLLDILLKKIFSVSFIGEYFIFDFLKLKLATNYGIAFGLNLNYNLIILFYLIIMPSLLYILFLEYKRKNNYNIFGLTFIIFGSFSNLVDRLFYGQVIDYIDLKYYSIFNLADVMIVFGVAVIILDSFWKKQRS